METAFLDLGKVRDELNCYIALARDETLHGASSAKLRRHMVLVNEMHKLGLK